MYRHFTFSKVQTFGKKTLLHKKKKRCRVALPGCMPAVKPSKYPKKISPFFAQHLCSNLGTALEKLRPLNFI
jgi:hypothetical protein